MIRRVWQAAAGRTMGGHTPVSRAHRPDKRPLLRLPPSPAAANTRLTPPRAQDLTTWAGAPLAVKARLAAGSPLDPRVILRRRGALVKGHGAGREEQRRAPGGGREASGTVSSGRAT